MKRTAFLFVLLVALAPAASAAQVGPLDARNNLSDIPSPATALSNIGGLSPTGNASATTALAPGAPGPAPSLGNRFGEQIDAVADYGMSPAVALLNACSVGATSTAVTCVGSSFTSADVGKWVVFRTAGAGAASLLTTIATVTDALHMAMAAPSVGAVTSKTLYYGADNAAKFAAAVAAATTKQACVWLPPGAYGLSSQSAAIVLNNACLLGQGVPNDKGPYTQGSTLLIFDATTPVFTCGLNNQMSGVNFFWPMQDGVAATPIAYPALISDASGTQRCARLTLTDLVLVNPYVVIETNPANTGFGAWQISDIKAYCISTCFSLKGGSTAYVQIANFVNSAVTFPTEAALGTTLQTWTNANSNTVTIDLDGATVTNITGFQATNMLSYGVAQALHVKSGRFSAVDLGGFFVDGSRSAIFTEGDAIINGFTWHGGYVYCQDSNSPSTADPCINLNSTGAAVAMTIQGVHFVTAAGSVIKDTSGTSIDTLTLTGNEFSSFGQSTTNAQYFALTVQDASATLSLSGNVVNCAPHSGSTAWGFLMGSMIQATATNNIFKSCQQAILGGLAANTRRSYKGNVARGTGQTAAFAVTAATNSGMEIDDDNVWDKPLASTITSGFGTGPSITCRRNWRACTITVGTSNGGSGVIAFPWTQANNAACSAVDNTTAVALKASATTTAVTVAGAMVDGDSIVVNCDGG